MKLQRHEQRQAHAQWPAPTHKRADSNAVGKISSFEIMQRLCVHEKSTYGDVAPYMSSSSFVVPSFWMDQMT